MIRSTSCGWSRFTPRPAARSTRAWATARLRQFDWGPLLELNRAVLVGRVRRPLTRWQVDGQTVEADQSYTLVRIVLPVKPVRYQEEN